MGCVGGMIVVFNVKGYVIYFFKEVLLFIDLDKVFDINILVYYYVGVYVYCFEVLVVYLFWFVS